LLNLPPKICKAPLLQWGFSFIFTALKKTSKVYKLILLPAFICLSTLAYAQKTNGQKPQAKAAPSIQILATDPTAKENKQDNSWMFTKAKLLLHGTDTLYCDTMICKPEHWTFLSNVRLLSPDGLTLHTTRMVIDARPKKK
jgi:hypothetical protein